MGSLNRLTRHLSSLAVAAVAFVALAATPASAGKVLINRLLSPGTTGTGGSASGTINGVVGGTLRTGKWTLEVPPGAFLGTATVSMVEGTESDGSPKVDLNISDPRLNSFLVPVFLSHTDPDNANRAVYWWDPVNQVWREVPGQIRELLGVLGIKVKAPLFHFSTYCVRGSKAGW